MGGFEALILIAAAIGLTAYSQVKAAGHLIFVPGNITGISLDGIAPIFTAQLIVQNTSNVDFTLNSLAGNVTADSTQVGNVSNFQPVFIPSNSQAIVPLQLRMLPLGIVDNLINAFFGGFIKKEMIFDGYANANGHQVEIKMKFNIG